MPRLIATLLPLLAVPLAVAQQQPAPVPAGSNWSRIQTLPAGTSLHINGKPHTTCTFAHADDDSITCTKSNKPVTYPRAGITSIKLAHRTRSTLVGLGIGAGTGALIGFAAGTRGGNDTFFGPNFLRGAVTAVGAAFGGVVGTPIGYFTDFTAGSPIYKAP
jgi:hypothetical protein